MHPDSLTASSAFQYMAKAMQQVGMKMDGLAAVLDECSPVGFEPRHRLPDAHLLTPQLLADLRGSLKALRTFGWARGDWFEGGVCGLGAGMVYMSGQRHPDMTLFDANFAGPYAERLSNLHHAYLAWLGVSMPYFNDKIARTPEHVIGEIEALTFEVERWLFERYGTRALYAPLEEPRMTARWIREGEDKPVQSMGAAQLAAISKVGDFTITPEAVAKLFDVPLELIGPTKIVKAELYDAPVGGELVPA